MASGGPPSNVPPPKGGSRLERLQAEPDSPKASPAPSETPPAPPPPALAVPEAPPEPPLAKVRAITSAPSRARTSGSKSATPEVTAAVLGQARKRCQDVARQIRTSPGYVPQHQPLAAPHVDPRLEAAAEGLALLLPGAAQAIRMRPFPPRNRSDFEIELDDEALLALGALDLIRETGAGQRALLQAALAQRQGQPTFLDVLPRVAADLGSPDYESLLLDNSISPVVFRGRGMEYLCRVAESLAQAGSHRMLALYDAGKPAEALELLRAIVCKNTALFSVREQGGPAVVAVLEQILEAVGTHRYIPPLDQLDVVASFHSAFQMPKGMAIGPPPVPRAVRTFGLELISTARTPRAAPAPPLGDDAPPAPATRMDRPGASTAWALPPMPAAAAAPPELLVARPKPKAAALESTPTPAPPRSKGPINVIFFEPRRAPR